MTPTTKPNVLTRKLGPLPVYAWALLAAASAWFFFFRGATAQVPAVGQTLDATPVPAARQNSPTEDALISQLQSTARGGTSTSPAIDPVTGLTTFGDPVPASNSFAFGDSTDQWHTLDSGVNNAPVESWAESAPASEPAPMSTPYAFGDPNDQWHNPGLFEPGGLYFNAQPLSAPAPPAPVVATAYFEPGAQYFNAQPLSKPVSAPTPIVVQPAPAPRVTVGSNVRSVL